MKLKPSCKNNIFYSLSQQFKSKRRSFYLQNWQIYGLFYLKTKMGMAGLIFKPQPPYFANQYNFCRCINDVTMTFWYLYWFQICKKPLGVSFPGSSVLWPKQGNFQLPQFLSHILVILGNNVFFEDSQMIYVTITFWYLYWFQISKKSQKLCCPGNSVLHV